MRCGPMALAALAAAGTAHASTFFEPCESALRTAPFRALQNFYADKPELSKPESCFRLNDREFLVTVPAAGRLAEGLYAFDAKSQRYDLADDTFSPALKVRLEFDGPNRKHFALLESSDMHGGDWRNLYEVLFLTPKSTGRVFLRQALVETHQGGDGPCPAGAESASSLEDLHVENEATEDMKLVFDIKVQRCSDGKASRSQKRFTWTGKGFEPR